jgi:5-methyltetrahydropteroyltriglutamate--homocysteine methyltransferase
MNNHKLLPTTVVGSYPQPAWLVDREKLRKVGAPRVRAQQIWRISEPFLEQAQDDATVLAIRDMEAAGIDIVTDGEIRRESYSNRFATALDGIDLLNPHIIEPKPGLNVAVPRVIGQLRRTGAVEVRDMEFLRRSTTRQTKITLPGPFTMSQQARNEFYKHDEEMAMDLAQAVNEEARALEAAGADVIQLDEPWLRQDLEAAKRYGVKVINRALEGLSVQTAVHLCFGYGTGFRKGKPNQYDYLTELADSIVRQISIETAQINLDLSVLKELPSKTIILGVIDLSTDEPEAPSQVADRIRNALRFVTPERVVPAPDCGLKFMSRDLAFAKLSALSAGAALVRRELTGETEDEGGSG